MQKNSLTLYSKIDGAVCIYQFRVSVNGLQVAQFNSILAA